MSEVEDDLAEAKRVTDRLITEIRSARKSMALFEALNGIDETRRAKFHKAANDRGLGSQIHGVVNALIRDVLQTLLRMTDQPSIDNLTLCRLSKLLTNSDLRQEREDDARNWIPDSPKELEEADAARQVAAMKFITDLVPPRWNDSSLPSERRLCDLRKKMKQIRDSILAHSRDINNVPLPAYNEIREFLSLVSEIVDKAQLVFRGAAVSWKTEFDRRLQEANEFWDICQQGFLDAESSLNENDASS